MDDLRYQLYWPEPASPYDDFALFRGIRNAALLYLVFGLTGVVLGWW